MIRRLAGTGYRRAVTAQQPDSPDGSADQTRPEAPGVPAAAGTPEAPGTPEAAGPAEAPGAPEIVRIHVRRAPRYRAFVLTGVALGLLVAVVLAFGLPLASNRYTVNRIMVYFGLAFGLVGGLLGVAAALLVERRRP